MSSLLLASSPPCVTMPHSTQHSQQEKNTTFKERERKIPRLISCVNINLHFESINLNISIKMYQMNDNVALFFFGRWNIFIKKKFIFILYLWGYKAKSRAQGEIKHSFSTQYQFWSKIKSLPFISTCCVPLSVSPSTSQFTATIAQA